MAEYDFCTEHKLGVIHVIPDTLNRYQLMHFQLIFLNAHQLMLVFFIATVTGCDIPYHIPDSVSPLFSSSLQCLYLASNHVVTVKLIVSSISSPANCPRLCNQFHTLSDSVPPAVLKEDIPFPTSTALDDLELLQPLN